MTYTSSITLSKEAKEIIVDAIRRLEKSEDLTFDWYRLRAVISVQKHLFSLTIEDRANIVIALSKYPDYLAASKVVDEIYPKF